MQRSKQGLGDAFQAPATREPSRNLRRRLAALRFNPSRCWFGHDWKRSNGVGYTVGNSRMAIFYSKDCRRCGKHEDGSMLV